MSDTPSSTPPIKSRGRGRGRGRGRKQTTPTFVRVDKDTTTQSTLPTATSNNNNTNSQQQHEMHLTQPYPVWVPPQNGAPASTQSSSSTSEIPNNTTSSHIKKKKRTRTNKPKPVSNETSTSVEKAEKPQKSSEKAEDPQKAKKRFFDASSSKGGAFTSRGNFDQLKKDAFKQKKKQSKADKQSGENRVYNTLTERLIHTLADQTHECIVCYDTIKRHVATWSCSCCYGVFHLFCIKKWATESVKTKKSKDWICPGCQQIYVDVPNTYYCFCKKHVDPPHDMFITPHSCGEECGARRQDPKCPHHCTLACHPGPCPPCIAMRDEVCYCGKESFHVPCSAVGTNGMSCSQTCEKLLNCRRHTCEDICHAGSCTPCDRVYEQSCFCGKKHEARLCEPCPEEEKDEETGLLKTFSCDQQCPKILPCGHRCDRVCHPGKCVTQKAAWGETSQVDANIDEYIQEHGCLQQCKKKLPCGHICRKKCHPSKPCIDESYECSEKIRVFCSCGRLTSLMECAQVHSTMKEKYPEETKINLRSLPPLLECDKECKRIQRIKMLANAFEIDFEKKEMPEYSKELQDVARKDPQFLKLVEEKFDELLFDSLEFKSYQFKPMRAAKRRAILELAEKYNMHAQELDPEPYTSVSVLKMKRSARPMILLSDVIGSTDKMKILQEKLKEKEEEEKKEQEKLYLEQLKRREARFADRQPVTEWTAEEEVPVFANNVDQFNMADFRETQKTKSAPRNITKSSSDASSNIWNALGDGEDM